MIIRVAGLALLLSAATALAGCANTAHGVVKDVKHDGRAVGHAVTGH